MAYNNQDSPSLLGQARGHSFVVQHGIALIAALVILLVTTILGLSAAHIAISGQKITRNERDRQVAFEAAEAALLDAEYDISPSLPGAGRAALFSPEKADNFVDGCGANEGNPLLGLCRYTSEKSAAA